ncbi:Hypothetical protein NocV09_03200260 [Nannochloropsis oceanica]
MHASPLRPSSCLLVIILAFALVVLVQGQEKAHQNEKPTRPFSRLQSTTGSGSKTDSAQLPGNQEAEFTKPTNRVGYLLNLTKNGLNPVQAFRDAMNTEGFKAILDNSEIQHRVLKELPLLGAIEGFSKIKDNRRLSAEDTKKSFATGMDNLLNLANDAFFNKVNDPAKVSETVAKMATSPDPSIQALFQRAQSGEKEAVEALQDEFTKRHYTGLDGKAFREISMEQTASKMEQLPEMMHFIEKDPSLAQVFKDLAGMKGGNFPPTEEAMMASTK